MFSRAFLSYFQITALREERSWIPVLEVVVEQSEEHLEFVVPPGIVIEDGFAELRDRLERLEDGGFRGVGGGDDGIRHGR